MQCPVTVPDIQGDLTIQDNLNAPFFGIDGVVANFVKGTPASCNFFRYRCLNDPQCGPCLLAMKNMTSVTSVLVGLTDQSCRALYVPIYPAMLIWRIVGHCRDPSYHEYVPQCAGFTAYYTLRQRLGTSQRELIDSCGLQVRSGNLSATCQNVTSAFETAWCTKYCSPMVTRINNLVTATMVIGALSVVSCPSDQ